MSHHVSWFAGIDLGDHKHHVHLTDAAGAVLGRTSFSHGGRGIAQLLSWLVDKAGADPGSIGVALEVPHGAVVDGLLDRGFATFAVNPKQADRGRELLVLSGAKDDPRDAEGLAVMLRLVPQVFRHLQPKHPVLVRLRDRSRLRADLVKQRTRLSQKIRAQLLRYFPAMWALAGSLSGLWGALFLTLWERAPTPERARRLHRGTVAKVLARCKIRKRTAEEVVGVLRQPAPVVAPGVTDGAVETVQMLVAQLRAGERTGEGDGPGIVELLEELPAALGEADDGADSLTRLLSMKGAGPVVAAGLFGEAGDLLVGGTFEQTRAYLGAAPITRKSGGKETHHKRRAFNRHGQNALYHFGMAAIAAESRLPATKGGPQGPWPQPRPHPQNPRGPAPEDLPRHAARQDPLRPGAHPPEGDRGVSSEGGLIRWMTPGARAGAGQAPDGRRPPAGERERHPEKAHGRRGHCYWPDHCSRPSHPLPQPLRSARAPGGPERSGGGAQRLAAVRNARATLPGDGLGPALARPDLTSCKKVESPSLTGRLRT